MLLNWCPDGSQNPPKIDKKSIKNEVRKSIGKNYKKCVKKYASRPCWERFWLQSELKSQHFRVVPKCIKKVTQKGPKTEAKLSKI